MKTLRKTITTICVMIFMSSPQNVFVILGYDFDLLVQNMSTNFDETEKRYHVRGLVFFVFGPTEAVLKDFYMR